MLTTVASRNAMPEPSTVAVSTVRPRADAYRRPPAASPFTKWGLAEVAPVGSTPQDTDPTPGWRPRPLGRWGAVGQPIENETFPAQDRRRFAERCREGLSALGAL